MVTTSNSVVFDAVCVVGDVGATDPAEEDFADAELEELAASHNAVAQAAVALAALQSPPSSLEMDTSDKALGIQLSMLIF